MKTIIGWFNTTKFWYIFIAINAAIMIFFGSFQGTKYWNGWAGTAFIWYWIIGCAVAVIIFIILMIIMFKELFTKKQ